ncbi:MAG: hypothetical protein UT65_C0013G0001, partial [Parcubacteria group bacterium GW2011_GWF2_39_8b]
KKKERIIRNRPVELWTRKVDIEYLPRGKSAEVLRNPFPQKIVFAKPSPH